MKNLLFVVLFVFLTTIGKTQQRVLECKNLRYYANLNISEYIDYDVAYKISMAKGNVLNIINTEVDDTLFITFTTTLPDRRLRTGELIKSYYGLFNNKEFAIITFAFEANGLLADILLSDGFWLMIYKIYYKPNTEL